MGHPDLVVASNRGPVSFRRSEGGDLVASRGGGGLVSSLGPLVAGTGATWVAAAMSDADREAAAGGAAEAEGFRLRLLDIDADVYRSAYDVVANGVLWFLHHRLWDLPRTPRFDRRFREAWDGFRAYNRAFADAIAEEAPDGATVLVQDYHLALVPLTLRERRPDLRLVHFSHTPFCGPEDIRVLPDDVATELLEGMAGHHACGFHTPRWAEAFSACVRSVLGRSDVATFAAPLAPDPADVRAVASGEACAAALADLEERIGDRKLLLRVDRIELSKNVLRGFHAFDELLEVRPEWRERVVFAALLYPSREALAEYRAYRTEVQALAAQVNERWATPGWTPVLLDEDDDFPRSVAALRRFDALLVNPVRDGLNLVAKEGLLVNERDGLLVLSREAGSAEELGSAALVVNPFDVSATAEAMHRALACEGEERARQAAAVRELAAARTPADWLDDQLAAARPAE